MTKRIRLVATALLAGCLGVLPVAPAHAAVVTETVQGQYLRIVSSADWSTAAAMGEGEAVRWDLVVSAHAPDPGTVRLAVSAAGAAPIVADVRMCEEPWQGGTCASGARVLRTDWSVPRDGSAVPIDAMSSDTVAHLRLDVKVGRDAQGGASTRVRVLADGFGDSVQVGAGSAGSLPATGGSIPVPLLVVGGVLVIAAAGMLVVAARRRREGDD